MGRSAALWLCAGTLWGLSATASADRAVVLPGGGDERLPREVRREAEAALVAALEAEGVEVWGSADVARRLAGSPLKACRRTDCADDVARELRATYAAGIAVWAGDDPAVPATVAVSLVTPSASSFPGDAPVKRGDVAQAARLALAAARDKQRLGSGPWIHVRGRPEGAQVLLDGTAVGVVPHRGSVPPGRHELTVRLTGYAPETRAVDVPLTEQKETVVSVSLRAVPGSAPAAKEPDEPDVPPVRDRSAPRSPAKNAIVVGACLSASVPFLASGLTSLVRDGDVEHREGGEVTRVHFGTRSKAFLTVGAGLLAGAVGVGILRPLRVRASVGGGEARLSLEGRF